MYNMSTLQNFSTTILSTTKFFILKENKIGRAPIRTFVDGIF